MKAASRRPREKRRSLARDEIITAELLRTIFHKQVIKRPLKMPTDESLRKLAEILEHWRGFYWCDQVLRPLEIYIADTTRNLIDQMEILERAYRERDERPGVKPQDGDMKKLRALRSSRPALSQLSAAFTEMEGNGSLTWRWLSNALPTDFERTMCSNNPSYSVGLGHSGPLARFVAAILPHLTGESFKPESVATELKQFKLKWRLKEGLGPEFPVPNKGE